MHNPLFLAAALLLAVGAHAQAPADGGPAPIGPTQPLLDGAAWPLAGGIGCAVRRLRQHRANP